MPDDIRSTQGGAPADWGAAFAALPLERPDRDAWPDIAPRLRVRARPQWPVRLAIAAALVLVLIVPLRLLGPMPAVAPNVVATTATATTPADPLVALQSESAQLERLLDVARDDRVSSGAAAEVAVDLDRQLARIDAALARSDLPRDRQLTLWQARVDTLRESVGFESTRRWLVAQGERYDGALVRVD
ncbi:hypothetical protein LYSHEL_17890 [Lysobacter helvus]|uniref:Uncharacterized protein n=2 Tax=Lysobacteraceae TaxID=32033 RepID=A0ABN6FST5_9GAMM|nr:MULTISPECIES: hypothetical protein [Lysobacter]BCT92765.1 hypothetical protein LYSCAS_17890 [Lysobacter caseinilyticus]BCT95918.1 hypothetical protein LYSHEL_17890 [Lysobacter helvus]